MIPVLLVLLQRQSTHQAPEFSHKVGGVINMEGKELGITEPFLTIAGQTAPSPQITLIDCGIRLVNTHDIIIQHMTVESRKLGIPCKG
jgi:hypothetical protein